jgi:hypothetical protein
MYDNTPCEHDYKLVVSLNTVDITDILNKNETVGLVVIPKLLVCRHCYHLKNLNA